MLDKLKKLLSSNLLPVYCFGLSLLVITFLSSNLYKTQSIISLSQDDSVSLPSSLLSSSLISNTSGKEIEELKVFLESGESLDIILEKIDINKFFGFPKGGIFSSYFSELNKDPDYLSNHIDIQTNNDSGTLSVTTSAFNGDDSYNLNLMLIALANYYFTRKQNYSAQLKKMNALCELAIAQAGETSEDFNFSESTLSLLPENVGIYDSSNGLLLDSASKYSSNCRSYIENEEKVNNPDSLGTIYEKLIQTETEKSIKSDIFKNTVLSLTSSSKVNIVSEPKIANYAENKNVFLNSFLVLVLIFAMQITFKVISRVYSDFK